MYMHENQHSFLATEESLLKINNEFNSLRGTLEQQGTNLGALKSLIERMQGDRLSLESGDEKEEKRQRERIEREEKLRKQTELLKDESDLLMEQIEVTAQMGGDFEEAFTKLEALNRLVQRFRGDLLLQYRGQADILRG